jgi:RNA polymerase sigma factor (sigma-70 family)
LDGKESPATEQLNALFASLFKEHYADLLACAKSARLSQEIAEDLVQETYTVALQKISELYYADNRKGWLKQTLRNQVRNHQRGVLYAQRLQRILEVQYSETRQADLPLSVLYENLVSRKDLDLLIRYWVNGETARMIADDLGINEETCKKRIQRASARFKKAYNEEIGRLE